MKTLMTANGSVIRRKDGEARDMVAGRGRWLKGDYTFCPKSEWKKIRPNPKKQGLNKVVTE